MYIARNSACNHGTEGFAVGVEHAGKGVEPLGAEPGQVSVKAGEQHKPDQKRRDQKADAWMENIKEFIRNIDIKSL